MAISDATLAVAAQFGEGDDVPLAALSVAVPHYYLRVSAVCVERRALPIIQEFILRSIAFGFHRASELASFLGLPEAEVRREIAVLASQYLVLRDSKEDESRITESGRKAISAEGLRSPVTREIQCLMNAVTRTTVGRSIDLLPLRRLLTGTLALPRVPVRPPRTSELDLSAVKAAAMASSNLVPRTLEIARLGAVIRTSTLFQPAHLTLRRESHRAPTFSIDGTADLSLAERLGSHPAIQALRRILLRQERQARAALVGRRASLRGQGGADADLLRKALLACNSWIQADEDQSTKRWSEFAAQMHRLVAKSHWANLVEFQLLLEYAIRSATRRLVVVCADSSDLGLRDLLLEVAKASISGVAVEVHLDPELLASIGANPDLTSRLAKVSLLPKVSTAGWCGVAVDDEWAVVGLSRQVSTAMGSCVCFFGTVVPKDRDGETLLREFVSKSAPVFVRRTRVLSRSTPA